MSDSPSSSPLPGRSPLSEPRPSLSLVSYLAPNWFGFYQAVADFLSRSLSMETTLTVGVTDPLADPLVLNDRLDLAFICGLPLIRHHQRRPQQWQALVAPVMIAPRYGDRPVYFADVVVRASSPFSTMDDLAGTAFCYNDLGSNSGYDLPRHWLVQHGYTQSFWGTVVESGAHQRSLQWVAAGMADWAAIDSTVLEQELRTTPALATQIRVIESIGPCPMPPLVGAQRLGLALLEQIRQALLQPDDTLQQAMAEIGVRRYAPVHTRDYDAIFQQYQTATGS